MDKPNPVLSVILSGRNDNYREDFIERLKITLASLKISLYGCNWELVLVDYNQVPDRLPLSAFCEDYTNIRHVVISNEEHNAFIRQQLDANCNLFYNVEESLSEEQIYSFDFFGHYSFNRGLELATGKFVLATNIDDIFPLGFSGVLDRVEENVVYRVVKRSITKEESLAQMHLILAKNKYQKSIEMLNSDKKSNNLWKSQGNFTLMDRNSWIEIGGYLPILHPRPRWNDGQAVFFALCLGKKMFCPEYYVINIHAPVSAKITRLTKFLNYQIEIDDIKYNHFEEMVHPEWRKFRRWALTHKFRKNEYLELNLEYKTRMQEIIAMFKNIVL